MTNFDEDNDATFLLLVYLDFPLIGVAESDGPALANQNNSIWVVACDVCSVQQRPLCRVTHVVWNTDPNLVQRYLAFAMGNIDKVIEDACN